MKSEENQLQRLQIIKSTQTQIFQEIAQLQQSGALNPEMFAKIRKPYADVLYTLGVKDPDTYLPTEEEVTKIAQSVAEAQKNKQPSPDDQAKVARAHYDEARAQEISMDVKGETADKQLEAVSLLKEGKAARY
jgi:hypothetical protein